MTTVWVTSLPRSLSSATMRVLASGCGLTPFADPTREGLPHGANPHGYFESMALNGHPVAALTGRDLTGHCLKVFARCVRPLLDAGIRPTHDILLRRPIGEIIASWDRWFPGLRRTPDDLVSRLDDAEHALTEHSVPTLVIHTRDLIADPTGWCGRINEFLGGGHNVTAMAALIDPSLYGRTTRASPHPTLTAPHPAPYARPTEGVPMSAPQVGLPVQFNVAPGTQPSGATVAAGLITGVNANGTVNVRGFADMGPTLLQRPEMGFQDAPAAPLDLAVCWAVPTA